MLVEGETAHRVEIRLERQVAVEHGPEPLPPDRQHDRLELSTLFDEVDHRASLHPPNARQVFRNRARGIGDAGLDQRIHARRIHLGKLGAGFEIHHHRADRREALGHRRLGEILVGIGEPGGKEDVPLPLALGVRRLEIPEGNRRARHQHRTDEHTRAANPRM